MVRELLAKVVPLRHARAPAEDAPATSDAGSVSGLPDASRRTLLTRGLSVLAGAASLSKITLSRRK